MNSARDQAVAPSRFLLRLLDPGRKLDYALAFAVGAWPALLAYLIDAHRTIGDHVGYWDSHWWTLAIVLPALLFAFRRLMARVVPVMSSWPPPVCPPIVDLVHGDPARRTVYEALRRQMLTPRNLVIPFFAALGVHVLDAPALLGPYFGRASCLAPNWASMFEVWPAIDKGSNLLLLGSAGVVQFALVFLGLLAIALFFRHNLFFLRNVYQRRWVPPGEAPRFFQVDVGDVNRCFGFRVANQAFNAQVQALMLAGAAIFLSRYGVLISSAATHPDFLRLPPVAPEFGALFPLPSQWLMALSWLVALAVVALPAMVKLLPRLSAAGGRAELSIGHYLHEFFSDDAWPKDRKGRDESLPAVAARFAQHSFWPTGDNRAGLLFFFAYWIFFVTLVPVPLNNVTGLLAMLVVAAGLAYLGRLATFAALRLGLRYVDELLVDPANGARQTFEHAGPPADRGRDVSVFISYRRRDSAPYARSLHERLSDDLRGDRVFMDIADIVPGDNFVQRIDQSLAAVDAVIVLIGDRWLSLTGDGGRPRIHDPRDMVHLEVARALDQGKRVFPVLVGGARMPAEGELPAPLRDLAELNAVELSDSRWDYDVGRLVDALKGR